MREYIKPRNMQNVRVPGLVLFESLQLWEKFIAAGARKGSLSRQL